MEHYQKLFRQDKQNDRERVMKNTYALNESLHKKNIDEKIRAQFVGAFCAAQWPPVRLPVATRRCQWPGLISHFSFNHNDVVFRHPLEQRVG